MTILLYGEPGTGKTSIARACVKRRKEDGTRRNKIVVGSMSAFKNNNSVMDYFHNNEVFVGGKYTKEFIENSEKILLLDDFDADTTILHKRKKYKSKNIEDDEDDDIDDNDEDDENADKVKNKKQTLTINTEKNKAPVTKTLSGFLTSTDGFITMNKVFTILATNHIDHLDEAVTRSGRVDLLINLKKMLVVDANKLIVRFFSETVNQKLLFDYQFTPATLRSYCMIAKNIHDLENIIKNPPVVNNN